MSASTRRSTVRPRHVLLVDDTTDNRELYATFLVNAGYRVTQASAGMEALREVERNRPDMVVIDIGLPDIDGLEVCRRIKVQASLKGTQVIAFTALPLTSERLETAGQAGPEALLMLPFLPEVLLDKIRALLGSPS